MSVAGDGESGTRAAGGAGTARADSAGADSAGADSAGGAVGRFDVLVEVRLRPGISDPQGATIERALPTLGFAGIGGVSTGKAFRFHVDAPSEVAARRDVDELCRRFLTNPVIEDATVTMGPSVPAPADGR
ncbi:MAG: phosphoribosylformylglycinamidine synthase subunit PurS [Acidimicrobiales bacterium]